MFPFIVHFKDNAHPLLKNSKHFTKNNEIYFEQISIAVQILTPFLFDEIKNASFAKLKKEGLHAVLSEIPFLLYVSNKEISKILTMIQKKVEMYFLKEKKMNFYGFLHFFLKEERTLFTYYFIRTFEEFFDQGAHQEMKDLRGLIEQRFSAKEVVLAINEKKEIRVLKNGKNIKKGTITDTESIISNLIYYAPDKLIIHDPHYVLPRDCAMLIKQLFKQKVDFNEGKYNPYSM